jgi:hypothetical protein
MSRAIHLNPQTAHNEWLLLQSGNRTAAAGDLARVVAAAFMADFSSQGRFRRGYIWLLCRMAAHQAPEISAAAMQALYGTIIEGLCDDFSEPGVRACNLVLVQILTFVRGQPQGRNIAALLARTGIRGPAALLPRYRRIRHRPALPFECRRRVQKVVILSRVSVGADIAITSIIIQRLREVFPQAEMILIGPRHLADFFAAVPRLRWLQVEYKRQGSLLSRLDGWPLLVEIIERESKGLTEEQLLVFDPDSRLSQLGLLPLAEERRTCYFNSRANPTPHDSPSLPALTNGWLNQLLTEDIFLPPGLFLAREKLLAGRRYGERLRRAGTAGILVLNLGVGGNQRKRINGLFEEELLIAILQAMANTVIVLDTGSDPEEKERTGKLLAAMRGRGVPVASLAEEEMAGKEASFAHGVVGFSGGLGALGGLVAMADAFCGYDSSGQHLASALGIPAVIVFTGAPNPRFLDRWRSLAPATLTLTVQQPLSSPAMTDLLGQVVNNLKSRVKIKSTC